MVNKDYLNNFSDVDLICPMSVEYQQCHLIT